MGPKPTMVVRTVEAGADVALEEEQHCWHVVPQQVGVQSTMYNGYSQPLVQWNELDCS